MVFRRVLIALLMPLGLLTPALAQENAERLRQHADEEARASLERRVAALEAKVEKLGGVVVAYAAANVPVPNGDPEMSKLDLPTKIYDPLALVQTGSDWRFTVKQPGIYRIDFQGQFPADVNNRFPYFRCDLLLLRLGAGTPTVFGQAWTFGVDCDIATDVALAAGDQVFARVAQASGAPRTLSAARFHAQRVAD